MIERKFIGPDYMELARSAPHSAKIRRNTELPSDTISIIAIDPGGITGWSVLVLRTEWIGREIWDWPQDVIVRNRIAWWHGEIDCRNEVLTGANNSEAKRAKQRSIVGGANNVRGVNIEELKGTYVIKKLIDQWPDAAVVIEGFQLLQMAVDLSPVRIIARIEDHLWENGRNMFTQMPAMKATATDARMKEWNVYTPNDSALGLAGHARDADRHAMMFLRKAMSDSRFRTIAWPHIYPALEVAG